MFVDQGSDVSMFVDQGSDVVLEKELCIVTVPGGIVVCILIICKILILHNF